MFVMLDKYNYGCECQDFIPISVFFLLQSNRVRVTKNRATKIVCDHQDLVNNQNEIKFIS